MLEPTNKWTIMSVIIFSRNEIRLRTNFKSRKNKIPSSLKNVTK